MHCLLLFLFFFIFLASILTGFALCRALRLPASKVKGSKVTRRRRNSVKRKREWRWRERLVQLSWQARETMTMTSIADKEGKAVAAAASKTPGDRTLFGCKSGWQDEKEKVRRDGDGCRLILQDRLPAETSSTWITATLGNLSQQQQQQPHSFYLSQCL